MGCDNGTLNYGFDLKHIARMKSPNTINDPHLPSLGGGGQGFKESFSKFYSDMARRAWLVLKNVCKAGILNLCRRSITINESSGFVNM
jgi:hypothetical protein